MLWKRIGYVALCVVAPITWGLLTLWTSNWLARRVLHHGRRKGLNDVDATMPPIDYHI